YEGGSVNGAKTDGIPRFILFDHTGKMVFNGHPSEANKKLADVMKNKPDPLVGAGPYKKLSALTQKIKERKELGKILTTLKTKHLVSSDADEKSEAEQLVDRLSRYGNRLSQKAEMKKLTEPLNSYNLYREVATLFKGDEIGDNADKVLKELIGDKTFQDNMKADKELADIMPQIDKLKPCGKTCQAFNKGCDACKKKNPSFDAVLQKAKALVQKYPSSPAANKVKELLTVE
ncbi:MAG: hypothetical protein V1709_03820, partial [Planctomycetota bacterium]